MGEIAAATLIRMIENTGENFLRSRLNRRW